MWDNIDRSNLTKFGFEVSILAKLWHGNQATIYVACNLMSYERTKHIEIYYFILEKIQEKLAFIWSEI